MLERAARSTSSRTRFVALLRDAWREYERDHARYFAGAMVYYALVSLVPLTLLLLAGVGLLLRFGDLAVATRHQVLGTLETNLGVEVRSALEKLINQIEAESVIATTISLIGLVWAASALFRHLRLSFRAIWRYAPPFMSGPVRVAVRETFTEYATAYLMVLIGGVVLVLAILVVSLTQWLGNLVVRLPLLDLTPAWLLALPGSILFVGLTFAFLFRFLPPVRVPWRDVWLATALCTVAWIVGAEILVLLTAVFGQSRTASSAFGGLLVMMLWINVVSQLLFYGAEICKVLTLRAATDRGA